MRILSLAALIAAMVPACAAELKFDLAVYGSTPAGIASAVVAARQGHRVALIEPTAHVGGLLTGGLSYTDFRTQESVTGFFREYMDRVLAYYSKKYGAESQQVKDCFFGAHAEPHVSSLILKQMMNEQKTLTLLTGWRLQSVDSIARTKGKRSLEAAHFETFRNKERLQARFWIDATYEGDLAAAAGVPYRLGRESTREFGERYAGRIFFDQGKILPGSTGEADRAVQCSNFRIIMTNNSALRLPVPKPKRYRREDFVQLLPLFERGAIREVYTESVKGILRLQRIPNQKADMNDIKQAPIRLALPGENQEWPEGDWATRERIAQRHLDYDIGLLYFLRNDPDVPASIRESAGEWGLSKDEFPGTAHLPPALYIREGRRMEGIYIFTEHDTQPAPQSVRAPIQRDSIAIGDYSLNSHGHTPQGPLYPNLVEGDFGASTTPFQIPYGIIVPKQVDNLLVPVAVSATHVGYSALRLEPTWTAMGHAAGLAAHLQLTSGAVPVPALQRLLHAQGQATIYTSDVPPAHKLFAAVQWAGLQGLLSDLVDYPSAVLDPLKKRHGLQYSYAFALHDLSPDKPLDEKLLSAWRKRIPCAAAVQAATRGQFLEKAYSQCAR